MTKEVSNAAVIRVHKNKNYTVMSNNHLKRKELSLKAKGLMSLILALPDNWNYSINGLVALSKDGREGVMSALKALKEFGYLTIEKERIKGCFHSIYHIFENPQETSTFTESEKPMRLNRCGSAESVNPQQLNTNNKILKTNTKKQSLESARAFGAVDLFNLYKELCPLFPQPREFTGGRHDKAIKRVQAHPGREYWETVFKKAVASDFCKASNFFSFDWILKNDTNALKVFEGNYDNKKPLQKNNVVTPNYGKPGAYQEEWEKTIEEVNKNPHRPPETREEALKYLIPFKNSRKSKYQLELMEKHNITNEQIEDLENV